MMTKRDIARTLKEIAFFLRLQGDNPYRAQAYERAGAALLVGSHDLAGLIAGGSLTDISGIGPGTASVIKELFSTGSSSLLQELQGAYPSSLVELGEVPGLSMKQIRRLHDEAGIRSVADLHKACRENRLLSIRGVGPKVQARVLAALGEYRRGQGYRLYADVLDEAGILERQFTAIKGVETVTIAGALRRKMEVIAEYHFVFACEAPNPNRVMKGLAALPDLTDVRALDSNTLAATSPTGIPIIITLAPHDSYGFHMLHATGSSEHLDQLLARFNKQGFKSWETVRRRLKEAGEHDLYRAIGLPYVPPELREGRDELEMLTSRRSAQLIEPGQIQGFFHFHTDYSDGAATVEQMVAAARARGYRYLGISDHSQSAFYANGMKEPRIRAQWAEIAAVQQQYPDIHIFKGIEADILPDGSMDYADEFLAEFDFVIASVHSRFNLPEADQTRRICRALANPYVTMLGHPTGRLLLSRPGYRLDLSQVIEAAVTHGKLIEINGSRHRLDLDWRVVRAAKARGAQFCVNPDAHAVDELQNVPLGVNVARKGGLSAGDVANTKSLRDMQRFLSLQRRAA
jgi:DNA polymerase (family X)